MGHSADADLLPALRAGGRRAERAFEAALDRWAGPLVGYLGRMTGCRGTAEDLAQEALARLVREAPRLGSVGSLQAWVWTVATNLGRDHLRRRRFELASAPGAARPEQADPADPLEAAELRDAVQKALIRLPEPDRLCLLLKDMQDQPYELVAEVLGVTTETARVRVHRARERFREAYRPLAGEEDTHAAAC